MFTKVADGRTYLATSGERWLMGILVIGANGKIGRLICKQGADRGMEMLGMVRNEKQVQSLDNLGVRLVVADLEGELAHAFDGVTHVVFTAGSGGHTSADKTLMVDLYGAVRAIDESKKQYVLAEKANRFSYKGSIEIYEKMQNKILHYLQIVEETYLINSMT